MSGTGAPDRAKTAESASDLRIAIVAASWHQKVMDGLIAGAHEAASRKGAEARLYRVPGSFELPVAARRAAESGCDAVVALGVIIRGGTPHFEYVSQGVTQGLTLAAVDSGVPITFGVLTCDDEEQALDRAGLPGSSESKGAEAFDAAVSTALTLREIGTKRRPYPGFTPA